MFSVPNDMHFLSVPVRSPRLRDLGAWRVQAGTKWYFSSIVLCAAS